LSSRVFVIESARGFSLEHEVPIKEAHWHGS
jgi:hypothetical protein